MRGRRSARAEALWRERLARFESGDLTVAEFCRREGVSQPSFYGWRKRVRQERRVAESPGQQDRSTGDSKEACGFVPVRVSGLSAAVIEFPNGVTVRVPLADVEALRTAILAAGEACGEALPC